MKDDQIQEKASFHLQLKNNKKAQKLKENGITLIALVVTIIILIILAGVSVAAISSENGIIKMALKAKERTMMEGERERLYLELTSMVVENNGRNPSLDEYLNRLVEKGIITEDDIVKNEDGSVNVVTDNGFDATLDEKENGEIGVEVNGTVDSVPPRIIELNLETTTNSIKVIVKARQAESYKIEYKEEEKEEYIKSSEGKDAEGLIGGLVQNKRYTIKVTAKNKHGEAVKEKTAITTEVPTAEGVIEFEDAVWDSTTHKASVKIKKSEDKKYENYKFQYAVKEDKEELYKTVEEGNSITVSNIEVNNKVYARLIDKNNNAGNSTNTTVKDNTVPEDATIKFNDGSKDTETEIGITITQSDNQSGVNIAKCKWVCNKSNAKIGTGDDVLTSYSGTFKNETETIKLKLTEEGNYYIHVLTEDKVGKRKETISEGLNIKANSYTLTFNSVGGSNVAEKTIKYGSPYGELPKPTKTGYRFLGWFTAETGGTEVTKDTKMTTKGATIYAHWETNSPHTFSAGGTSTSESEIYWSWEHQRQVLSWEEKEEIIPTSFTCDFRFGHIYASSGAYGTVTVEGKKKDETWETIFSKTGYRGSHANSSTIFSGTEPYTGSSAFTGFRVIFASEGTQTYLYMSIMVN